MQSRQGRSRACRTISECRDVPIRCERSRYIARGIIPKFRVLALKQVAPAMKSAIAPDTVRRHYDGGIDQGGAGMIYIVLNVMPIAAATMAGLLIGWIWLRLAGLAVPGAAVLVAILTAITGLLMIANFPYYSFKNVDFRGRVPFVAMIVLILLISLVTLDPPSMFLLGFLAYGASGPVMQLQRWRQSRQDPD